MSLQHQLGPGLTWSWSSTGWSWSWSGLVLVLVQIGPGPGPAWSDLVLILVWPGLVWCCFRPTVNRKLGEMWHGVVMKGLMAVPQHAEPRQAGSAEAGLWPLRKGMWKLFHPGQKLKTPGGRKVAAPFCVQCSWRREVSRVSLGICCSVFV